MKKPRGVTAGRPARGTTVSRAPQISADTWHRLFDLLPIPAWIFDRESLAFLAVNQEAVNVYGYTRNEFLEMTIKEIRPPEEVPPLLGVLATLKNEPARQRGWRHRKKDGALIDVEVRGCPMDFGGREATVVVVNDVTAEQVTEAERARLADLGVLERQQLVELSHRLLEAQETERRELARALHDEIGQLLTALRLMLEGAAGPGRSEEILHLVADLQSRVHVTSLNLRPPMLDHLGLLPALLWHVDRYTVQTGVRVHFTHHGLERRFPPRIETSVFRVVQESLNNVARYAGVREVGVRVTADAVHLAVEVDDHGTGFDVASAVAGDSGGLVFMRERLRLLRGTVNVWSSRETGTRVTAWLPLENDPAPGA